MITEPKLAYRGEHRTAGIRSQVPMQELPNIIPQQIGEVEAWLGQKGIATEGAPYIRYYLCDMGETFDVEVGWPVANAVIGEGRINAGVVPAGQYAVLTYTGPYEGLMDANAQLEAWAQLNGVVWDRVRGAEREEFRSRLEIYTTDPEEEPDPQKWETEVLIKVVVV